MRLIDADICLEKIKDMPVTYDAETVQRCIEIVSNAPTIDAIPIDYMRSQVDSGKWEEIITRWKEHDEVH